MTVRLHATAYRVLLLGVLLAWGRMGLWLQAVATTQVRPLHDSFFPSWLQQPLPFLLGVLVPPCFLTAALLTPRRARVLCAFTASAASALLLLLHQASHCDAAFQTAFWSSLFGLWLCTQHELEARGKLLSDPRVVSRVARVLIAFVFLGGFVGKLTPGYWSGASTRDVFLGDGAFVALAREVWTPAQLEHGVTIYARIIIVTEGLMVTLPLWRGRPALIASLGVMAGMFMLNGYLIICAVGPLMGVASAALCLLRAEQAPVATRDETSDSLAVAA